MEQLLREGVEGEVHVRVARRVDGPQVVVRVGAEVDALWIIERYVEGEEVLLPHDAVRRDVGLVVAELALDDEASELATPEEVERLCRRDDVGSDGRGEK